MKSGDQVPLYTDELIATIQRLRKERDELKRLLGVAKELVWSHINSIEDKDERVEPSKVYYSIVTYLKDK